MALFTLGPPHSCKWSQSARQRQQRGILNINSNSLCFCATYGKGGRWNCQTYVSAERARLS
eukprot:3167025-Pyramimonas_sp.AAC.1